MKRIIKRTFVPHTTNNPRPIFWHPFSIASIILILLFLSTLLRIDSENKQSLLGDIRSGAIISFTNKERKENNVPTLEENEKLNEAARLKAQDMASKGYFAHYSPEGTSPWFWFTKVGYDYQKAGENLAVNFDDSKEIVDAWMNSPTHKENIIKEGYTQIGIGTATGIHKGKEATYVVQLFASPRTVENSNALALSIEKKGIVTEQSSVRGISITKISNIKQIFDSNDYLSIITMVLFSILILVALSIVLIKWKQHTQKFYFSIILLIFVFIISLFSILNFFEEVGIRII